MKKLFVTIAAVILGASMAFAQDLATVTETYNNGIAAFQAGNQADALAQLQSALSAAEALGEEGAEVAANCKTAIPGLQLSIAKGLVNKQEYDEALAAFKKAQEFAVAYGDVNVANEIIDLIPKVYAQKGNSLLKDKDYAGAVKAYDEVLAVNPTDAAIALRKGQALSALGNKDEAVKAFELAAANGQEEAANKQLSNIYLKEAAALLKAKNYAGAVENALKVNEYGENAKAYQIAGQTSQLQKKNNAAIEYFEKYLELSPSAANAGQIAFTVAALHQQAGNKAKAIEFYQKASSDAKLGAEAQKQIAALK